MYLLGKLKLSTTNLYAQQLLAKLIKWFLWILENQRNLPIVLTKFKVKSSLIYISVLWVNEIATSMLHFRCLTLLELGIFGAAP